MASIKYLTKSRFVMATECARKLSYELDDRYPNAMAGDEFLKALADGGHQVGALARLVYGGGTLISDPSREDQARHTADLLKQSDVTIYEGTVIHDRLLVRCDILVKSGNSVRLIEVKSKSSEPAEEFSKEKDGIRTVVREWESYLYDLTYQSYVLGLAYPDLKITPCLLLVDKTVPASIPGLNSAFRVTTEGRNVTVTVDPTFDVRLLVPSILREFDASQEVVLIRNRLIDAADVAQTFEDFVSLLTSGLDQPTVGMPGTLPKHVSAGCKGCQFYLNAADHTVSSRSGWHQCMTEQYGNPVPPARRDTFFGIHGNSSTADFIRTQPLAIAQMSEDVFPRGENFNKTISPAQRQRLQWEEHRGKTEPHILAHALQEEIDTWTWPLHFIDFETAAPALPYTRGRRPYEQILFQFSHHVLHEDGRLVHQSQHLEDAPGVSASLPTVRKLMTALNGDQGTVLHWWAHERNILNAIRKQILETPPPDVPELLAFLENLIGPPKDKDAKAKGAKVAPAVGQRLKDLGWLISRTAFYPGTGGSNSIKKVLPSVLKTSAALRNRYAKPIYGTTTIPSLNFTDPNGFQWVVMDGAVPCDPYTLLNPLMIESGVDALAVEEHEGSGEFIANGGAAMMAYDRLQQPSLQGAERQRLITQLLRYCELDTLAMVMVFQSVTGRGI